MKKSELKVGDILELRNGYIRKVKENNRIETLEGNLVNNMNYYNDNLLYNNGSDVQAGFQEGLDVVRVYRLIQERKPEILTEKEKIYICNLIKPFLNEVEGIAKKQYINGEEYIYIIIKDDMNISLPNFVKGKYYKNMELNKKYTLEELGINV